MKKTTIIVSLLAVAFLIGSGFVFRPKPELESVDVTTRIEMIGGHQYVIAVSSTAFNLVVRSSIAMVHHEGCTTCARNRQQPTRISHRRPPIAAFYEGQM